MLIWPFCLNLHYSHMNLSLNGGNRAAAEGKITTLAIIQRGRKEVSPICSLCNGRLVFTAPSETF